MFNNWKNVQYDGNDVDNNPWFKCNDICSLLQYKDKKDAMRKHVSRNNKKMLRDINNNIKDQPQTLFFK